MTPAELSKRISQIAIRDRDAGHVPSVAHVLEDSKHIRRLGGSEIVAVLNPVRSLAVSYRSSCPICPADFPADRPFVKWRTRFIRANDHPVFDGHLLDIRQRHSPHQLDTEGICDFVSLASIATDYVTIRNEGECAGASVLTHDHNQLLPWAALESIFPTAHLPVESAHTAPTSRKSIRTLEDWPARGFAIQGHQDEVVDAIRKIAAATSSRNLGLNLAATRSRNSRTMVFAFPRTTKWPSGYPAPISHLARACSRVLLGKPIGHFSYGFGTAQMFGLMIATERKSFERLTSQRVHRGLRQASVGRATWQDIVAGVTMH